MSFSWLNVPLCRRQSRRREECAPRQRHIVRGREVVRRDPVAEVERVVCLCKPVHARVPTIGTSAAVLGQESDLKADTYKKRTIPYLISAKEGYEGRTQYDQADDCDDLFAKSDMRVAKNALMRLNQNSPASSARLAGSNALSP